jgi:hypothetical protein
MNYKYPLPAGQLLEYYKGRLYVASGNYLYFSDPYADYYDQRRSVYQFNGEITLLRAVESGIFIADGKTHFLKGDSPLEFQKIENILDSDAIIYSDGRILGEYIGKKVGLEYAIWTSTKGICIGDPEGSAVIVSDSYAMQYSSYRRGAGLFWKTDGKEQYIGVLTI